MFDYTRGLFKQTVYDVKKLAVITGFLVQIFQIIYLIYALIAQTGIMIANAVLLFFTVAYFAFSLYLHFKDLKYEEKIKRLIKTVYGWGKRIIKFFTLFISVYGFIAIANEPTTVKITFSLILLIFMVIAWIVEILLWFLVRMIEKRGDLFIDALKLDVEPLYKANNFIQKIRGLEVEDTIVEPETRKKLTVVAEHWKDVSKQKKAEKKASVKQQIAENRAKRKSARAQARADKKQAKKQIPFPAQGADEQITDKKCN